MKLTLLMAITLDGKIGKDSDHFPDWTEKADKKLFVEMTKRAGVIIMGSKTYDTIGSPLPGRKNMVLTRKDRTSDNSDLVFTSDSPSDILQKLETEGYSEAILAGGSKVNTIFAKAGLIDELVITISPLIFGSGLSIFESEISVDLALEKVEPIGDNTICVKYKVLN